MIINFGDFTIQEAQVILAALKKLPMEVVEQLHNRLLNTANEQFLAQQPQVNPDDITVVKKATGPATEAMMQAEAQ
jgi:hypothetical protein